MSVVHRDNNELYEKSHLNDIEGAGVGGIDVNDDNDMPITSDLHYYVRQATTSTSERTTDAEKFSEPKDDEKNIARRRKLTLLPFRRIGVFLMIICLVAIGTILGVTFSPKNSNNSSSISSSSIEEDEDINGGPIFITTEVPIEENIITVDELEEEDNNINNSPNNSRDDDEDDGTRLVVIEVKEHRLNSVEIDAAQNNVALEKRGAIKDGNRKLNDVEREGTLIFSLCDPAVYYDSILSPSSLDTKYDVSSWTREMLQPLLEKTHRSLPYTDKDGDDVWKALKDIDRGINAGSVRLIYSQKDVPSEPKGTFDTWNREHTWPKSLGVGKSGPDYTDIHHLFPSDASVNTARSNRYFDTCTDQSVCRPPSALQDNENINGDDVALFGGDVFQPPKGVRGDIARAIFYMDLRYPDLELTDCPDNEDPKNQMAYLSTLLTWHELDPPTEMERLRNDRVCSRWQGNRNPFVDYPDLATIIYGKPHEESDRSIRCNSNNDHNDDKEKETQPPMQLPIPGDVMITAVYSDNPDLVELVTLVNLPSGLTIHMTDNAYNGNSFASNEGTISLTLPDKVLAGTVFGYGEGLLYGSSWISKIDTGFALAARGDTVIVYYTTIPNGTDYAYLSALSYSGAFKGSGEEYGTTSSTLPESIVKYSVALTHKDNYVYIGPRGFNIKESSQENLVDTRNWEGSNSKSSLPSPEKEKQSPKKLPIPGDVMITAVYSDNPDLVELVTLVNLPSGLTIHMTDNAYNGNSFASNEGTISLTLPDKVLAGTVFGYGEGLLYGSSWISKIDTGFALAARGDTVIVYYTTIPNGTDYAYLSALSYSGAFKGSGEEYGTTSSTLPESIVKYSVALSHKDNYVYIGPRGFGIKESLQTNLVDTRNWEGSNNKSSLSSTPPQGFFVIEPR